MVDWEALEWEEFPFFGHNFVSGSVADVGFEILRNDIELVHSSILIKLLSKAV